MNGKVAWGDSLAFGVKYIKNSLSNLDGILISLIDQPLILTSHYLKMRNIFEKDKKQIIASESDMGWAECRFYLMFFILIKL